MSLMGLESIFMIAFSLICWIYCGRRGISCPPHLAIKPRFQGIRKIILDSLALHGQFSTFASIPIQSKNLDLRNTKARSAKPNQFCQHCSELVQKLQVHFDDVSQSKYGHHSDIHALFESARNGCHLCSMFSNKIPEHVREKWTKTLRPLSVRLSRSYHEHDDECTPLDLTLIDESWQEAYSISLHRHQRTKSNLECASILEKKDDYQEENDLAAQLSTGADATYASIKKWWQKCQSSHEDCTPSMESGRPTRLLDLNAFGESPDIKLVNGADTGTDHYVTLSYCWGGINPVMLRTTNIDDFRARLDWNMLPKTMKDAVTVCRKVGVRYLWIDALCIIQGPDGDFNTEAPRMEAVYAGSTFTIAAAYSKNSDEGCFNDVSPLGRIDCLVSQDSNYTVFIRANKSCMGNDNIPGHCSLDSRGWVYQERMLSPRTLFFGRDEIHWECRKGVVCAHQPDFEKRHFVERLWYTPIKHDYMRIRSLEANPSSGNAIQQFQPLWANVIAAYSKTNLSHAEDKLAAIAGVASIAQQRLKIEASFGLWLPCLLDELLWEVKLPNPQQQDLEPDPLKNDDRVSVFFPSSPSWSWASTKGEISFRYDPKLTTLRTIRDVEKLYSATILASPPPTPFIGLHTLVERHSTPPSVRVRGPLSKCRAFPYMVKFRICGFNLEPDRPMSEAERPYFYATYKGEPPKTDRFANHNNNVVKRGKAKCVFQPDFPITNTTDDLMCVLIKRIRYMPYRDPLIVRDIALVLQPTGADSNQYRRVGIYTEERPDWNSPPGFMFPILVEEDVEIV